MAHFYGAQGTAIPPEWDYVYDTDMPNAPPRGEEIIDDGEPRCDSSHKHDPSPKKTNAEGQRSRSNEPRKAKPTAVRKKPSPNRLALFELYNAAWKDLAPHDPEYPTPDTEWTHKGNPFRDWPEEEVMKINAMIFYLGGFGVEVEIMLNDRPSVRILGGTEESKVKKLMAFLRRTEQSRWHPDRLNRRTGEPGVVDSNLGTTFEVVAIRTAIQQLIIICEKYLE